MAAATPSLQTRRRKSREMYLLVLPALIPVIFLSAAPLLNGIYLGFTDARAGLNQETNFTGLDNYVALMDDSLFWSSFRIGLVWAVTVTVLQFFAALGLALLLNANLRFQWLARTLALVPWAMPPVIVGIMWKLVYHPDAGLLNEVLYRVGLDHLGGNWLGGFSTVLPAIIVVGVWTGMPQTTIVLLAGLQGVPAELHEAAAVDGASPWRRFLSITLPQLQPVIVAITSLNFIWNFNQFGLIFVLTAGGPGGKTLLPMLFAYQEAFRFGNFGTAAAMGNIMIIVIAGLLVFYLRRRMREVNS